MAVRTISVCTGYGGVELGLRAARVPIHTVAVIERQAYAAAVIAHHMERGALDPCPIWDDLESFDGAAFRGRVDLVAAGIPCQGQSSAGKRRGTADARWLWPEVWRLVEQCEASLLFLENVPGLLTVNDGRAFDEIIETLAARGWAAEWDHVPAGSVGAPHLRDRIFVLAANPDGDGLQSIRDIGQLDQGERSQLGHDADRCAVSPGWSRVVGRASGAPVFCRVDDGTAARLDGDPDRDWHERIHLLGNGVVPQAVTQAWRVLSERLAQGL